MYLHLISSINSFSTACDRPTSGCDESGGGIYANVDCEGDGILDHACSTTYDDAHWLVLSSEGCLNWGSSTRKFSECPAAWGNSTEPYLGEVDKFYLPNYFQIYVG